MDGEQTELSGTSGANPEVDLAEEDAAPSSARLKKLESQSASGSRYVLKGEIGRGGMGAS